MTDHADSELETSIDKLFDEGGSGSQAGQGDSAGVGEKTNVQTITEATDIVTKDVAPLQPRLQRLLVEAVLNAEVRGEPILTFPFVTSSVSATLEHSSHHSGANVEEAEVDSLVWSSVPVMTFVTTTTSTADPAVVVKEKNTKSSLFAADSSFAGGADPNVGVFPDLTESDFLVSGVRTVIDPNTDLQKVYMSLSTEIRMRAEYNIKEKRMLKSAVDEKIELLKVREKEDEVKSLKERNTSLEKERNAQDVKVTGLEASAMGKDRELTDLNAQLTFVHELEVASFGLQEKLSSYEYLTERLEEFQDAQLKIVNDNFDKLYIDFVEMALHLEERAAIGKAIEKGMQDGLSVGITHGAEGRVLTYVTAFNPSAKADYISALQHLQNTLAERLGLTESQPHVDQLMVPIHHSPDKVVIGATALSLSLDVSNIHVLTGAEGTSDIMPTTDVTTMAMSTTLTSASTVPPISVDDNEVVGMDDQMGADGNRIPFLMLMMHN
nr:hypothetical protein [Tanacetum cinerariifolium]